VVEVEFKYLKKMLAKIEVDLALKKERREIEEAKAKEELAEVERRAEEKAVEAYKVSTDFTTEKAWWW